MLSPPRLDVWEVCRCMLPEERAGETKPLLELDPALGNTPAEEEEREGETRLLLRAVPVGDARERDPVGDSAKPRRRAVPPDGGAKLLGAGNVGDGFKGDEGRPLGVGRDEPDEPVRDMACEMDVDRA